MLHDMMQIHTESCLTISFRYRVTTLDNEDNLYSSNSSSNVAEMESDDKSINDSTANKSIEKQSVVKRRFCREEKLSVLFDFVESHDLCPSVFESVAILLFHPKRSYDRNSCEGRFISDDITCDTLVWVEVTV